MDKSIGDLKTPLGCPDTLDGFIFMGINFRGFNINGIFIGIKIHGYYIYLHKVIQKVILLLVLEFVDRTLHDNHENWYFTKIKPFTVYVIWSFRLFLSCPLKSL